MSGWLDGELAAVRGELARVDAKCGTLTAIATGAAAFTGTQIHGAVPARVALAAAVAAFAAAVLVLLLALRPRLGESGWCRYLVLTPDQVARLDDGDWFYAQGTGPGGNARMKAAEFGAADLVAFAGLARAKYQRIRLATDLIGGGVVLLAAGLVAGVIA